MLFASLESSGLQSIVEYHDNNVDDQVLIETERESRVKETFQPVMLRGDGEVRNNRRVTQSVRVPFFVSEAETRGACQVYSAGRVV